MHYATFCGIPVNFQIFYFPFLWQKSPLTLGLVSIQSSSLALSQCWCHSFIGFSFCFDLIFSVSVICKYTSCKNNIIIIIIYISLFCLKTETRQHVVSSCTTYLEEGRYTWRHDSVLLYLAKTLTSLSKCSLYADLSSFLSPSIITGDSLRLDLVLLTDTSLYILELTVGFESHLQINSDRKKAKYHSLISDLIPTFSDIKFINLSMSTLGLLGKSSDSLLLFLEDLKFDKPSSKYIIKKIMNISIRCSYYIFCLRNKPWTNPALLEF